MGDDGGKTDSTGGEGFARLVKYKKKKIEFEDDYSHC